MLDADARKLAAEIENRVGTDADGTARVTATVGTETVQPEGKPMPGGNRPKLVRYHVEVGDGTRVARLGLGDADDILDQLQHGASPDDLFAAVAEHGLPIEPPPE